MNLTYDLTTTKASRGTNTKEYIVLHHTGWVASLYNMSRYLAKNPAQVSAHYVIAKDGKIARIGTEDMILWHAGTGNKIPGAVNTMNNRSIGIEVISDGTLFSEAQVTALGELVKELRIKFKIPSHKVIRHKDYSTRKWDIGDNFYKVAGSSSYPEWLNRFTEEEEPVGDYRRMAGDSLFSRPEEAGKTMVDGDPDERIAIVQLMAQKVVEKELEKREL